MREMGVDSTKKTSEGPKINSGAYMINKDLASIESQNLSPSPNIGAHLHQFSNLAPLDSSKKSDRAMGGPMGGPATIHTQPEGEGEELSYYALEISSIADLIQTQALLEHQSKKFTSLRVMHCDTFHNLNGIQVNLF